MNKNQYNNIKRSIIGDNCVVTTGSINKKNISSNSICAGVPAKVIKTNIK